MTRGAPDPDARSEWAFTLVELLVVIAIIGILAAMLLPVLSRAKENGRAAACMSNLHQIGVALQVYVQENDNTLPTMQDRVAATATNTNFVSMDQVLAPQLQSPDVMRCPSDRQQYYETTGSSYSWNSLLNGQKLDQLNLLGSQNPTKIPLFFDKTTFHIARGLEKSLNWVYADGHLNKILEFDGQP